MKEGHPVKCSHCAEIRRFNIDVCSQFKKDTAGRYNAMLAKHFCTDKPECRAALNATNCGVTIL